MECHATSTRQGDIEEIRALKTFFKPSKRTVLTSFKSQIGHTLGASGINNLIRGTMAMQTGIFPPTLNYEHPDPEMGIQGSGLLIAPEPFDWTTREGQPRRLQVNAFGFGGSNYVVQLEQTLDEAATPMVNPGRVYAPAGANGSDRATIRGISFFRTELDGHACRMAVVAQSDHEAFTIIKRSADLFEAGTGSPKALRALAQQGIFVGREDQPLLPLAFVFPGQGAQYRGMARDLYDTFPVIKKWMDRAAAAADFDILHLMFHDTEENLEKTRWQQPAMFAMEHAMARYLTSLGIHPVAMAGHSLGELTALCLAGVFSPEDGFRIVNMRALCMDKAAAMNVEPGIMAAVDAPLDLLKEMIQGVADVHIGNINSPVQVVLSGNSEMVRNICGRLKNSEYRATPLRVSMAFHSPIMKVIHDELEQFVASIPFHPPQIPVISNTTMAPYPSDPDDIRRILMAHLESTVHWMDNVRTLWNDCGVRLFVEVGPCEALSNLIADTLPEPACIQTCLPNAESQTYTTALAQLYVQGHLKAAREPEWVSLPASGKAPASDRTSPHGATCPALPKASVHQDHIEALIRIIMEATGFNRNEIEPDMDLRKDLSIRSSRLPIIMDAAERQFEITIELEDFIQVRTVRDIAQKISEIVARQGDTNLRPGSGQVDPDSVTPAVEASPVHTETPEGQEVLEKLILIIMDATGFEREEIQPEMDLRKDLSIRSSRLPIIMDAAERQFDITIELEDFMEARTVRDIAQGISAIIARQGGAGLQPDSMAIPLHPLQDQELNCPAEETSLKRLVFNHVAAQVTSALPLELGPGESILLLAPERDDAIAGRAAEILRRKYGVATIYLTYLQTNGAPGNEGYDILTDAGAGAAFDRISGTASLTGMVITLPHDGSGRLQSMADVAQLLKGFFQQLQALIQSPKKKFVLLIHTRKDADTLGPLLAEGLLGMFLSAAQEYPSVLFRTLKIEKNTDLQAALRGALDRGCSVVERIHRAGKVFSSQGQVAPSALQDSPYLNLNPGDVVVMSGGATGISAHLAASLVPFEPRLVFLGRTSLDSGSDRAVEIARTLADLQASGIEASYHTCDVSNPAAVNSTMSALISRYGRIDGIIHGAGVIRDGFLNHLTRDDFSTVTDVKFLGAWNLFSAAKGAGLKFFVGLSSVAAIQGNPGQSNYAAANRMMSALLGNLDNKYSSIRFKALMLPPVEGAGMANDQELRELLKRKGVGYIHTNELATLFCRELFEAPSSDVWVLFMRGLPSLKTALLDDSVPESRQGELAAGTLSMGPAEFPLIDRISCLDLRREELETFRTFSLKKDLWIADHKPFTFVKHPLVSAVMILETFMEAARILYPHLRVRGVRQVLLMDMILCPPGLPRPARITCRRDGNDHQEVVCTVSLATQDISPSGRLTDRFTPHCTGQVILDGGAENSLEVLPDFPVRTDELRTKPMDHKKVLAWYKEHSGLTGRYRVIESIDGAGPGVVRGRTIYRETRDFDHLRNARYQYSPYLFEALMQLVAFQIAATDSAERRSLIPLGIGELRFGRKCRDGERITVEARLRLRDKEGLTWDARGIDDQGRVIMQVHGLRMHWVLDV